MPSLDSNNACLLDHACRSDVGDVANSRRVSEPSILPEIARHQRPPVFFDRNRPQVRPVPAAAKWRLVVVSNRLPEPSGAHCAGGLVSGLRAALSGSGALWFGWSGMVSDFPEPACHIHDFGSFTCASIDLTPTEHAGYYDGFANRALWPWFHGRTDLMAFDRAQFSTYRAVNRKFAETMLGELSTNNRIWIHDFHLIPLGRELRRLGVAAPLGFFLHVPFPPPATISALPCHRELLDDLSDYDLVGFQTGEDEHNFHDSVIRFLGGTVEENGDVFVRGRRFRTGVFPIGIDAPAVAEMAEDQAAALKRPLGPRDSAGVVAVDRLDYTKGLLHRMRAFERLLDSAPQHRGRTRLLQIAAPSREAVPEYARLKKRVRAEVERINAKFSRLDRAPILYLNQIVEPARLAVLFRLSRVALITPLRDGMNLVAKEYVAAQHEGDPGVLILSRFAGAAERLNGAMIVDPYDSGEIAGALRDALSMSLAERLERWRRLIAEVRHHDVHDWRRGFLAALSVGAPRLRCSPSGTTAWIGQGPGNERLRRVRPRRNVMPRSTRTIEHVE